ncbi:MAG: zinc ribbon domain-containing protein [Nitrospirae bacterium]|nr:zinc ribbon domain-containing protein [Nitrospirota bacterium]
MPIYEYKCEKCGIEHEVMQKITAKPLTVCEKCGGRLKKLISSTSFVLKGSGWYVTDYADKNRKSSANEVADKKEKADSTAQKETKKEKTDSTTGKETKKEKTENAAGTETKKESKSEPKTAQKSKE